MNRTTYYEELKALALEKRTEYGVTTADVSLSTLQRIYRREGIHIDYSKAPVRKMKAAYFYGEEGASVLVKRLLPEIPRIFAMVHELKHHLCDRDQFIHCCAEPTSRSPVIEIGAEEFAAEFIYPQAEFEQFLAQMGIERDACTAEQVVHFKRNCGAKVSYLFIQKRLERLQIIPARSFGRVKFQNLEYELYGLPFRRQRQRR